jgi:hypothetical protein
MGSSTLVDLAGSAEHSDMNKHYDNSRDGHCKRQKSAWEFDRNWEVHLVTSTRFKV